MKWVFNTMRLSKKQEKAIDIALDILGNVIGDEDYEDTKFAINQLLDMRRKSDIIKKKERLKKVLFSNHAKTNN